MNKLFYIFILFFCLKINAQKVGINTSSPQASSVLDLYATDKGVLAPRVYLDSVTGITTPILNPAKSLFVINTNPNVLYGRGEGPYFFNRNGEWEYFLEGAGLDDCYDKGGNGAGYFIDADSQPVHFTANGAGVNDAYVVTGKLTNGVPFTDISTFPNFGDGTTYFFYPKKAAFRAGKVTGSEWDDANIGRHSFATGLNVTGFSNRSFVAGFNNSTQKISATSFGSNNTSNGEMAILTGNNNTITGKRVLTVGQNHLGAGYSGLVMGFNNNVRVNGEVVFGTYSKNYPKVDNTGGNDPGSGLLPVGTDSQWSNYDQDRVFAIGIGTGVGAEKNAFEVIKDGTVIINEAYKFPLVDGANDQILQTDGNDNLSWRTRIADARVSSLTMNADDGNVVVPRTQFGYTLVPGYSMPFILSDFDEDGDGSIEVFVSINYINRDEANNGNDSALQIVALSDGAVVIANGQFTYTAVNGDGIAYTTAWQTLSIPADVSSVDGLSLYARNFNGGLSGNADNSEITFTDVTFYIRDK